MGLTSGSLFGAFDCDTTRAGAGAAPRGLSGERAAWGLETRGMMS